MKPVAGVVAVLTLCAGLAGAQEALAHQGLTSPLTASPEQASHEVVRPW